MAAGMKTSSLISLASFVALSLSSLTAFAHEPYAPTSVQAAPSRQGPDREGLTLGFGLGVGQLQINDDAVTGDSNLGVSLRAGFGLSQRFLIVGSLEGTRAQTEGGGALQLNFAGVSAQAYLWPRLFVSAGLGYVALDELDRDNQLLGRTEDDSLALLLGVGFEILQTQRFAMSVELRGFAAELEGDTVSGANALLGFQWY